MLVIIMMNFGFFNFKFKLSVAVKEIETVDRKVFPVLRLFTEFVNSICLSQVPEKALIQIVACIVDTQEMTVGFIELCLSSKV